MLPGNIVIDGVAASSYSALLTTEAGMHRLAGGCRLLWHLFRGMMKAAHARRVAEPVMLALGRIVRQVGRSSGLRVRCVGSLASHDHCLVNLKIWPYLNDTESTIRAAHL